MVSEMERIKTTVTEYLDERQMKYEIKYHSKPVFTSEEAATERGVNLSQVVKTMVLTDSSQIMLAVLPANRRLDLKKARKMTGSKNLQFASKDLIENRFGLVIGAIAPFGNKFEGIAVYVDSAIFDEEVLDISSGDPRAGLELHRDTLRTLLGPATFCEIT